MKVKYSLDDVSIEYINSFMDENAKTIEKELESTREKLEKVYKFLLLTQYKNILFNIFGPIINPENHFFFKSV